MNKKGVEMSLQLMVVAALVLIILVILTLLLTRSTRNVHEGLGACIDRGYTCDNQCTGSYTLYPPGSSSCDDGEVCCAPKDSVLGLDDEY